MTLHHLRAVAALKQGVRVVTFDRGQTFAHKSDALADTVTVADPAQLHAAFGGPRPDSSAGVHLSAPDASTAAEIAAAIGRTPTESE